MTTIDGIPVYRVLLDAERDGMVRISLVDDPAVMSDFQKFDHQAKPQRFAIQDEEKRLVRGVVARADFPVFRVDETLGEHYVIFPAGTIREMAEKYLTEGRADRVDGMHDGQEREGIHLVQWFIKDTEKGVNPTGFEDIADGSLFAEYHVVDDQTWQQIKDETFKGFSMEVFYTLAPENNVGYVQEVVEDADGMFERIMDAITNPRNMNKKNLLRKLGRMLSQFASVTTDKGILAWDGDEDLKAGDSVYIEDTEGERTPAADGNYVTEDGKTIVVEDGKVSEIRDPEAEVAPASEEMASKATDKGALYWDGEEDLKEGDKVFTQNEDGETQPAPDGEYKTEDGKVITVVDGVVASIEDVQAEVAPSPDDELRSQVADLQEKVNALIEENTKLQAEVERLGRIPLKEHAKKGVTTLAEMNRQGGETGPNRLAKYLKK